MAGLRLTKRTKEELAAANTKILEEHRALFSFWLSAQSDAVRAEMIRRTKQSILSPHPEEADVKIADIQTSDPR